MLRKTKAYDAWNALICCKLSAAAYETDRKKVISLFTEYGFSECFLLFETESECVIAHNGNDQIIVAFTGTESWYDAMSDIKVDKLYTPHGGIHSGFSYMLNVVYPQIIEILSRISTGKSIWITGHSLGGALALLLTYHLHINNQFTACYQSTYTFGCPRVGDSNFVKYISRTFAYSVFHVVNHLDVVTRIPPRIMGYHALNERIVYIDGDCEIHFDKLWWEQFLGRFQGTWQHKLLLTNGLKDHLISEYVEQLEKLARKQ
ncbi:MAG: lipase family protein [SAR324 cluster bacterium]|nr:lipase family protein [SAR324 cluster bacterium]